LENVVDAVFEWELYFVLLSAYAVKSLVLSISQYRVIKYEIT